MSLVHFVIVILFVSQQKVVKQYFMLKQLYEIGLRSHPSVFHDLWLFSKRRLRLWIPLRLAWPRQLIWQVWKRAYDTSRRPHQRYIVKEPTDTCFQLTHSLSRPKLSRCSMFESVSMSDTQHNSILHTADKLLLVDYSCFFNQHGLGGSSGAAPAVSGLPHDEFIVW